MFIDFDLRAIAVLYLPHIVSGIILAFVSYTARTVRVIYKEFKGLPARMRTAEAKITHLDTVVVNHETRIKSLEEIRAGKQLIG